MRTTDRSGQNSYSATLTERDQEQLYGYTALWRAVLYQAAKDLTGQNPFTRSQILTWITTNDFEAVCDLAGVNPDYCYDILGALAVENGARQKYILKKVSPWLLGEATDKWNVPQAHKNTRNKIGRTQYI